MTFTSKQHEEDTRLIVRRAIHDALLRVSYSAHQFELTEQDFMGLASKAWNHAEDVIALSKKEQP